MQFFGAHFILQNFCSCKKNDKYQVCTFHQGLFDAVLIETNTTDYFSSERESTLTFELDPKGFYHFGPLHFLQADVLLAAPFSIHNSLFDPGHKTLQSKSASRSTSVEGKCSTN